MVVNLGFGKAQRQAERADLEDLEVILQVYVHTPSKKYNSNLRIATRSWKVSCPAMHLINNRQAIDNNAFLYCNVLVFRIV